MKIETTSSGRTIDVREDAPTKTYSEDFHTTPLRQRKLGDYFYVKIDDRHDFIHAKRIL